MINSILTQIKFCAYECEGGPLENNIAFQQLVRIAQKAEKFEAALLRMAQINRELTMQRNYWKEQYFQELD